MSYRQAFVQDGLPLIPSAFTGTDPIRRREIIVIAITFRSSFQQLFVGVACVLRLFPTVEAFQEITKSILVLPFTVIRSRNFTGGHFTLL